MVNWADAILKVSLDSHRYTIMKDDGYTMFEFKDAVILTVDNSHSNGDATFYGFVGPGEELETEGFVFHITNKKEWAIDHSWTRSSTQRNLAFIGYKNYIIQGTITATVEQNGCKPDLYYIPWDDYEEISQSSKSFTNIQARYLAYIDNACTSSTFKASGLKIVSEQETYASIPFAMTRIRPSYYGDGNPWEGNLAYGPSESGGIISKYVTTFPDDFTSSSYSVKVDNQLPSGYRLFYEIDSSKTEIFKGTPFTKSQSTSFKVYLYITSSSCSSYQSLSNYYPIEATISGKDVTITESDIPSNCKPLTTATITIQYNKADFPGYNDHKGVEIYDGYTGDEMNQQTTCNNNLCKTTSNVRIDHIVEIKLYNSYCHPYFYFDDYITSNRDFDLTTSVPSNCKATSIYSVKITNELPPSYTLGYIIGSSSGTKTEISSSTPFIKSETTEFKVYLFVKSSSCSSYEALSSNYLITATTSGKDITIREADVPDICKQSSTTSEYTRKKNIIESAVESNNYNQQTINAQTTKSISVSSSQPAYLTIGNQCHITITATELSYVYISADLKVTINLHGPIICYVESPGVKFTANIYVKNNIAPSVLVLNSGIQMTLKYFSEGENNAQITTLGYYVNPVPSQSTFTYDNSSIKSMESVSSETSNSLICGYQNAFETFTKITKLNSLRNQYVCLSFSQTSGSGSGGETGGNNTEGQIGDNKNNNSNSSNSKKGLSGGAIAGIIIGLLVVVGAIVVIVLYLRKPELFKKKSDDENIVTV